MPMPRQPARLGSSHWSGAVGASGQSMTPMPAPSAGRVTVKRSSREGAAGSAASEAISTPSSRRIDSSSLSMTPLWACATSAATMIHQPVIAITPFLRVR